MPELPEVETTRRGLESRIVGRELRSWAVRNAALRWPVDIPTRLRGKKLIALSRRAKYLLFEFPEDTLILHLGMSGSLRLVPPHAVPGKHDHVDLNFSGGGTVRFNDPRRFGCLLCWARSAPDHRLLAHLGVEPLTAGLTGAYLKEAGQGPQGGGEELHHGQPYRRRGGQYLRGGSALSCRNPADPGPPGG